MDKYIEIIEEPKYNLMIKETICNWSVFQRQMYSYDEKRRLYYDIKPIYKANYRKKCYNIRNTLNKSVKLKEVESKSKV